MRSRSTLLDESLPPIAIERFEVEAPRPFHRPVRADAAAFRPPGYETIERLRRRYEAVIGAYRDFHPRVQSRVEHRVPQPATAVIDMLQLDDANYDSVEHEYRVPVDLHVAWSWPKLPMWLSVGELSSNRSALRLSLRSRRRLRYPKRYFNAAHAALSSLEHVLAGGVRSG